MTLFQTIADELKKTTSIPTFSGFNYSSQQTKIPPQTKIPQTKLGTTLGNISDFFVSVLKRETPLQKKVSAFLKPEDEREIYPGTGIVVGKEGYPYLKVGEARVDPLFTAALESIGTKVSSKIIKTLAKSESVDFIRNTLKKVGQEVSDEVVGLIQKTKSALGIKSILDNVAQKEASILQKKGMSSAFQFVSPSTKLGMKYDDAVKSLETPEHLFVKESFRKIDEELSMPGKTRSAVGDWLDGAEDTTYFIGHNIDKETLIYSTARKSKLANQKQGIWFQTGEGNDELYKIFIGDNSPTEIKRVFDKVGIQYKTIGKYEALIFNKSGEYFDNNMAGKIKSALDEIGIDATNVETRMGEGDFIGSFAEGEIARKEAQGIYDNIISVYEQKKGGVKAEVPIIKPVVNIERLNISQEAKNKIIKASEGIKPELEKVKGKVLSNDEVIEAAQLSEILRKTISREAMLKSEATILKTRQHLAELAKNEKLTPEFIDTLKIVSSEATKRGRELQALGIEADPSLGTIKTKVVKQLIEIGVETDKIIKASEGVDFNNAKQVTEFYRQFVKPKYSEIIDEYRYINMLSSPKTQIVNTFSNILQATLLRPATRLASGVTDNFSHLLTGKEQEFYIKQVPAYYRGALNSFGDALGEALKVMRGQQQIYRPDIKSIPTGLKVLKPFQIVPRLMEASDVFFRKLATAGEVEALMSKGMKEAEAISKAAETAQELVFRKALDPANKTGQGVLLSKIDALTTAVYKLRNVPGVKWFIPFVQTPMNILKQGIEYSPLGILTLPKAANKIEQFGKTLVGTTIFAGAGWLALKDRTTWAVPTNQKEKDAFYAAGMQAYSVKVGDIWVSYSRLGPIAYPIAMAAAIKFYTKDNPKAVGDTELQKITKILSGIAQFFSDQSYVQGIGDFVNLAQGDVTALTRAASQIPSQLIPLTALQRWVANIIDPIYRKTDKTLSVEGIIENLKKGIPGLTFGLPAYTTPTGEPSKRQFPFFNPLSPISISEESPEWVDYLKTLQQVSRERVLETKSKEEIKKSAQDLYDTMEVLPKEEARRQFDSLIQSNPDLAKEVSDLASETKLDYKESFFRSLGVENGQRAKYIVDELNKLSKEERRSYYQNLIDKKVITKQVNEQILKLLGI